MKESDLEITMQLYPKVIYDWQELNPWSNMWFTDKLHQNVIYSLQI